MNWHDRLRKVEEHSVMTVKLQSEVDKYKVRQFYLCYCLKMQCSCMFLLCSDVTWEAQTVILVYLFLMIPLHTKNTKYRVNQKSY